MVVHMSHFAISSTTTTTRSGGIAIVRAR
jgi:hypothetical protein